MLTKAAPPNMMERFLMCQFRQQLIRKIIVLEKSGTLG